ncbi:MAG: hypothetical protein WA970_05545 [Gammaproteobacteria bacterium]
MKATGLVPTLLFCSLLSVDAYALWPDAEEEARCFIQKAALELRHNAGPEAAALAAEAERMLRKETLTLEDIERLTENIGRNIRRQLEFTR